MYGCLKNEGGVHSNLAAEVVDKMPSSGGSSGMDCHTHSTGVDCAKTSQNKVYFHLKSLKTVLLRVCVHSLYVFLINVLHNIICVVLYSMYMYIPSHTRICHI